MLDDERRLPSDEICRSGRRDMSTAAATETNTHEGNHTFRSAPLANLSWKVCLLMLLRCRCVSWMIIRAQMEESG